MTEQGHVRMGEGAEFDAIRRMLAVWGDRAHGIGDDAAVLGVRAGERLVVSTDATVEGVHFLPGWLSAEELGGRAAAAALSDLAAMGASPVGLLLALTLPPSWEGELEGLAEGVGRIAAEANCPIVGGNITRGDLLSLTITVLGQSERPLMRSGACEGDIIFVTGVLGGPGAALRAWLAGRDPEVAHRARFAAPKPRIAEARWLAAHGATSAIDISDGLLADARHVARASGVSMEIDGARLPRMEGVSVVEALASGEEYELIITVPPNAAFDVAAFEREFGILLTAVGRVRARGDAPVRTLGADTGLMTGHDHLV